MNQKSNKITLQINGQNISFKLDFQAYCEWIRRVGDFAGLISRAQKNDFLIGDVVSLCWIAFNSAKNPQKYNEEEFTKLIFKNMNFSQVNRVVQLITPVAEEIQRKNKFRGLNIDFGKN